jgi:hypothetical protein
MAETVFSTSSGIDLPARAAISATERPVFFSHGISLAESSGCRPWLHYISASNPLCSIISNNFLDAPAGFLTPCSHFLTVDGLMLKTTLGLQKRAHWGKQLILKQEGPNLITTGVAISGLGTVRINLMKNWVSVNTK